MKIDTVFWEKADKLSGTKKAKLRTLYDWVKTGEISKNMFTRLCNYIYTGGL